MTTIELPTKAVGRLAGIAVAEPELREAIEQYTAALRSVPAPQRAAGQ